MKLKAILFGVTLILCGVTQAQVSKDSFEKTVDLLNCKTVERSLIESPTKGVTKKFQDKCNCQNSPDYNLIKNSIASSELRTIELSDDIEGLKKSFRENWKKDEVVTFLSESIFTDNKYQKIVAFATKRKGKPEFDTYKASLKTDLANSLVENVQQDNVIKSTDSQPTIVKLEKAIAADNDKSWFSGITSQIIVVSIIVSLLLSFLTLFLAPRLFNNDESEVPNNIKSYVKRKIDDATWNKGTANNNVGSAELRDVNNRIRDLESQIEKIKSQLNTSTPVQIFTTQPTYQETTQPEVRPEIFFLPSPNSDGSFDENSASSTYRDGATIYRFTKTGNNNANFQIDEKEASIILALQYRDKRIDPVCEATNAFNQAKHITTVQQGEAELQSGKWVVNKKAKIRYEN